MIQLIDMLILTSPAKTQDFSTKWHVDVKITIPIFIKEAKQLIGILKTKNKKELKKILNVSKKLVEENYERYKTWNDQHTTSNAKPALLAYRGDIYRQFKAWEYSKTEQEYAQKSVRIITGLYGMLKAYDLIQPYRLEMKTDLKNPKGNDLYDFWNDTLTDELNKEIKQNNHTFVLNLASKEYAKPINFTKLNADYVEIVFHQTKDGKTQNYGILSKFARGVMMNWCIENQVKTREEVRKFNKNGYSLVKESKHKMLFVSKSNDANKTMYPIMNN